MRLLNWNKITYIRDVEFYLTREEVRALYAANPLWTEFERHVYGTTPID